ncbi:superoxide dismutase family protein [Novosphingobium sp.]|uniref:superoxide dismutase family protein n=1 Tax=Novosphingobium sp. TaxID=1874826 RepID=UPI002736A887|nr:superoxide dismutase family protein [Novosphingobium sp.]MDP3906352.1 superoxide dismutase family protein [Novosphingobium sp.]
MKSRAATLVLVAAILSGCATSAPPASVRVAAATLQNADGASVGTAVVTSLGGTLTLNVVAAGISPGPHGIHLHAVGDCTPPGFTSAGGHLNPGGHQHGTANPAGSHLGDLPNIVAASSGAASLVVPLGGSRTQLESALFDADGTAIIIHAAADDYKTDPTGNSGARIVCGVLKRG